MKIKYYGTGAFEGVPALFCDCEVCRNALALGGKSIRTRSQALVNGELLIDFPPDTYMHMLGGLPLKSIRHCLVTHSHSDHFYPEDIIARSGSYAHGDLGCLTIYGTLPVCRLVEPTSRVALCQIEPFEPFSVGSYTVTALTADHDPASGAVFYLIERDKKWLLYANDTGYFPQETWDYLQRTVPRLSLASFDCTCEASRQNHMSVGVASEVRDRLAKMGCISTSTKCVLNHFSHNNRLGYQDILLPASKHGFVVSYDGLEIEF